MHEVNLNKLYQLGKEFSGFARLQVGGDVWVTSALLLGLREWARAFLAETGALSMPETHAKANELHDWLGAIEKRLMADVRAKKEAPLTKIEAGMLRSALTEFEEEFERESRSIAVFGVTPKDDKDVRILIEDAIKNWPPEVLAVLPTKMKDDLREAGRCLAFDRATACAFHVCRATEALMLAYYEKLAQKPWPFPKRDWGNYNTQLKAMKAPEAITTRLDEIRKLDRNAYMHPDLTVPLEDAPIIYGLCRNVIFLMAKEMM